MVGPAHHEDKSGFSPESGRTMLSDITGIGMSLRAARRATRTGDLSGAKGETTAQDAPDGGFTLHARRGRQPDERQRGRPPRACSPVAIEVISSPPHRLFLVLERTDPGSGPIVRATPRITPASGRRQT